jgi:hypothetical protein
MATALLHQQASVIAQQPAIVTAISAQYGMGTEAYGVRENPVAIRWQFALERARNPMMPG